ncbi:MAG: GAF domain-containing sensor histidine kinase [Candidatus Krumholzibacteria bacterium]|nr:GAF domain-containing sensor histidine kinase [Candidatus Krumholzibacteria bacterium]
MSKSLKMRILKAVGNDTAMTAVLSSLMTRTNAEFCAFITMRETELVYVMAESRDLAPHVPEIREKLKNTYRMFTNARSSSWPTAIEKIFFRGNGIGGAGGRNGSRIESYFLVPVAYGPQVRGVLFIGSVRKEAFGRKDIALFHSLADERDEKTPIIFQVGGEKEILERVLDALPSGAALFSPDGRIMSANKIFRELMNMENDLSASVYDVGKASCFNLHGVWEEFNILQNAIIDRELEGSCVPERYLNVSWVRLDAISPEVGSLALTREITSQREQAEAREEEVTIVAHELRTPLAALKTSLAIVQGNGGSRKELPDGRQAGPDFLLSAAKTVDRLGRLVDGLVESSSARLDERPLNIQSHDARKFLEEITTLFVHPMRIREIDFAIDVDDACRNLMFDRDRIEQVIQNLLANSMKHVPAGGSISISIRACLDCPAKVFPAELQKLHPSISFADLLLRDSGSGIPMDIADLSNTTESTEEHPVRASKGLGLVIAKRLMRMQGGSLYIDGSVEKGSAVHLFLPIDQETARVVKRYRTLQMKVDEMMAKGLASAIFVISKERSISWDEVAERCSPMPVINPEVKEMKGRDAFLWSLSEGIALALVTRIDRIEDPVAFLGESFAGSGAVSGTDASATESDDEKLVDAALCLRAGWTVSLREGTDLRDLMSIAMKRMEDGFEARMLKGVAG